jgi:16S rRNA A1518/A1519 N6-dimethyltransferase RsmA/KsgA/DIM1 with predicted DNA glycosylase/AP lyase activity
MLPYDAHVTDREEISLARPELDQYFLRDPQKIGLLVQAAGIVSTDDVIEIGAGIGTVARHLPPSRSLTLVELDARFTEILKKNVPQARVIQGDALTVITRLHCDVLLSNLPSSITQKVIEKLPELSVRTVVMATGDDNSFENVRNYSRELVVSIGGDDFQPPQPVQSHIIKLTRREN